MKNWTDHGEILRASQVPWGRSEGGFMLAPDCAYKNGTYYRDIFEGETGNASHWETHASTSMNLVAGDYVTVTMRSGAVTLPNGQDGPAFRNSFYGYLVG